MSKRLSKFFVLFLIVGLLATVGAGPALASDVMNKPGDSPANAVTPTNGPVNIGPGQWQWYTFRAQASAQPKKNSQNKDVLVNKATIDAVLHTQTGAVSFEVWSTDDLNNWRNNVDDFAPTGSGTLNEFLPGAPLAWQGVFPTNNNYYLIVKNRSAQAATYTLNIAGDVTFPSKLALNTEMPSAPAAVAQAQPVMSTGEMGLTVEKPAESAMTTLLGNDPSHALTPASGAVNIGPGQWQWYTFRAQTSAELKKNRENKDVLSNEATIDAVLRTQAGAVSFEVWSADDLNNWRNNVDDFAPTGSGTMNEFLPGKPLSWQGAFQTNNNYYLIVKNRSSQPATYTLDVTGDVTFPAAASQAMK
jgi:hypothetical protein